MSTPEAHGMEGLPAAVTVYEVGPRDGLQNEPLGLDVAVKAEFVRRLEAAGLPAVEVASFVHPAWVPQLADAEALLSVLGPPPPGRRRSVLVPNERGLDRALAAGATEVAVFASVTAAFARKNLDRTVDESLAMIEPVVGRARAAGLPVRGYLSMCFGDPWEGAVAPKQVSAVAHRLVETGVGELSLGDTIGVATPGHVVAVLGELGEAGIPPAAVAVHFHDTYGQALANTLTALRAGVTTVDASAGGLGGCPYAHSSTAGRAAGNLATEDLVWMLHGLGIRTGINLEALVRTSVWLAGELGRPSPSRVVQALAPSLSASAAPGAPGGVGAGVGVGVGAGAGVMVPAGSEPCPGAEEACGDA